MAHTGHRWLPGGAPAAPAEGPGPADRAGGAPQSLREMSRFLALGAGAGFPATGHSAAARRDGTGPGEVPPRRRRPVRAVPQRPAEAAAGSRRPPAGREAESRGGTMTQRREPRPAVPLDEELEALG